MTLKDLIERLQGLQEDAPDAEVLIENGEWCDHIREVKLRYWGGRDPVVVIVNPENLRGH